MAPNLVTILVTTREGPGPEAALPLFVSPAAPTTTVARPELESLGTGFFLDTGETLVSSYHVVGEIPHMTVRLADGSLVQATLRGTSLDADLAVFRVDRPPHGAVQLVDSARLRPGDWLALLADPFGSGVSVTAGVVRFLPAPEDARAPRAFSRFIGADLTVDAANQGGMVTDAGGRLVGLAASTTTAGSRVGLVLPVADLRQEIARLDGPDRASRSWIGLWVRVLVADDARDLGLDPPRGLLVTRIVPGGPADDAGILPRDAVLEFSGEPVTTPAAFAALASRADVSQAIPVVIWRDGRPRTVRLRPAPMPQ
jgi:serine protease Do